MTDEHEQRLQSILAVFRWRYLTEDDLDQAEEDLYELIGHIEAGTE